MTKFYRVNSLKARNLTETFTSKPIEGLLVFNLISMNISKRYWPLEREYQFIAV